nr:ABC transporter permease subunit [Bacillus velezensis]
MGYTIIGGALALTVFNLPVMVRVTEGALTAVPKELKEASLALGVSRWHTVKTVLIPSAIPSILTEPFSHQEEYSEKRPHCYLQRD